MLRGHYLALPNIGNSFNLLFKVLYMSCLGSKKENDIACVKGVNLFRSCFVAYIPR